MVSAPCVHPAVAELKQSGDKAYAARDYAAALERYSEALEAVQDAVIYSNRSAAQAQRRRFDKALTDAERGLLLEPKWPRLHHRRGYALFHLGRLEEAAAAIEAGLRLDPQDIHLLEAMATLREYTEPAEQERGADAAPPADPARSTLHSHGYGSATEPTEAMTSAAAPKQQSRAGAFTKAAGRPASAAAPASPTSPASPASPAAGAVPPADPTVKPELASSSKEMTAEEYREKGNEQFRTGKHSSAVRLYDAAIRVDPLDAKSWANRAAAQQALLEQFGRNLPPDVIRANPYFVNALNDLTQSLLIDPAYVKAWARKGQLLGLVSDWPEALKAYEMGLKINPQSPECQSGLRFCQAQC